MISDVVASTSLQYQLSTSLADPNLIMIFERYPSKNDLIDPHRKSVVFSWVRVPHRMFSCYAATLSPRISLVASSRTSSKTSRWTNGPRPTSGTWAAEAQRLGRIVLVGNISTKLMLRRALSTVAHCWWSLHGIINWCSGLWWVIVISWNKSAGLRIVSSKNKYKKSTLEREIRYDLIRDFKSVDSCRVVKYPHICTY